jgi:hypothetical protein
MKKLLFLVLLAGTASAQNYTAFVPVLTQENAAAGGTVSAGASFTLSDETLISASGGLFNAGSYSGNDLYFYNDTPGGLYQQSLSLILSGPLSGPSDAIVSAIYYAGDGQDSSYYSCSGGCGSVTVESAPEINSSFTLSALTLLLGGFFVLRDRFRLEV